MKHSLATVLLAASCLMAHPGASAQKIAESTIPFDFMVGPDLLPAGAYKITQVGPRIIELYSTGKHASALVLYRPDDKVTRDPRRLVFNKYGRKYFLSEIRMEPGQNTMKIGPSKFARQARLEAAALSTQTTTMTALK